MTSNNFKHHQPIPTQRLNKWSLILWMDQKPFKTPMICYVSIHFPLGKWDPKKKYGSAAKLNSWTSYRTFHHLGHPTGRHLELHLELPRKLPCLRDQRFCWRSIIFRSGPGDQWIGLGVWEWTLPEGSGWGGGWNELQGWFGSLTIRIFFFSPWDIRQPDDYLLLNCCHPWWFALISCVCGLDIWNAIV